MSKNGTLVILETTLADEGTYRANLTNGAGELMVEVPLSFMYETPCHGSCFHQGSCVEISVCMCPAHYGGSSCEIGMCHVPVQVCNVSLRGTGVNGTDFHKRGCLSELSLLRS